MYQRTSNGKWPGWSNLDFRLKSSAAGEENKDAQRGRDLGLGIRAADSTCRVEKMGRCDDDA